MRLYTLLLWLFTRLTQLLPSPWADCSVNRVGNTYHFVAGFELKTLAYGPEHWWTLWFFDWLIIGQNEGRWFPKRRI